MILGHVRDSMPRVSLSLPGRSGPVLVEFIVDTGFEGDLSLPYSLIPHLEASFSLERDLRLANGLIQKQRAYHITLEWNNEERVAEIIVLENDPLLGAVLLDGMHVSLDMTDGGDVQIEPL